MASVSGIVKNIAMENKLLSEGIRQGILSYGAVAEKIKKRVENELGSSVKESAIIMALRRHSETVSRKEEGKPFHLKSEIIMKTGLAYTSFSKMPDFPEKLERFYKTLNPEKDTFNIIHGNYEISIITNEKHSAKIKELLGKDNLKAEEKGLVSLSVTLGKDFAYTPGVIFTVTRKLYWDNVNIFELLTTSTELTFLFQQKDAMRAYNAITELMKE